MADDFFFVGKMKVQISWADVELFGDVIGRHSHDPRSVKKIYRAQKNPVFSFHKASVYKIPGLESKAKPQKTLQKIKASPENKEMAPTQKKTQVSRTRKWLFLSLGVSLPVLVITGLVNYYQAGNQDVQVHDAERVSKLQTFRNRIAEQLAPFLLHNQLVTEIELSEPGVETKQKLTLEYSIDSELQKESDKLMKSYRPDYGAIVAMDATTGRILAMTSFQKGDETAPNLALRGTYPAASVFKIVTATAAVDKYELSPDTLIMFNGGNHTLYKKNVMNNNVNRWTRNITLREAFARSINTVFARLTFERMQPADLKEYAIRFGFNQNIKTDLPFDPGFTEIPEEKDFHLAEVSSGYNRITRMSPIQGAMIAASVASDGMMRVPYIVDRARDDKGQIVFEAEPMTAATTMTKAGAERLRDLMGATVSSGTGRKSFRQILRSRKFEEIEMGGKTGSLQGDNPKGKVDWFVGYAIDGKEKIAVAAITVNKEKWTVKSTHLAQSMFRKHFGDRYVASENR